MPTRSAGAVTANGGCGSTPGSGCVCGGSSAAWMWAWVSRSGCKEAHLPGGVSFGGDVQQRRARRGQVVDVAIGIAGGVGGGTVAGGRQAGQQPLHRIGVEGKQPYGRGGRPGHTAVRRDEGRLFGREPGGGGGPPERDRLVRPRV